MQQLNKWIIFLLLIMSESILANNSGSVLINVIFLNLEYKSEYNDLNSTDTLAWAQSLSDTLVPPLGGFDIVLNKLTFVGLRNGTIIADIKLDFDVQSEMAVTSFLQILNNTFIPSIGSNITITHITITQFPTFGGGSTQAAKSILTNSNSNSINTASTSDGKSTSGTITAASTPEITNLISTAKNYEFSIITSNINTTLAPTTRGETNSNTTPFINTSPTGKTDITFNNTPTISSILTTNSPITSMNASPSSTTTTNQNSTSITPTSITAASTPLITTTTSNTTPNTTSIAQILTTITTLTTSTTSATSIINPTTTITIPNTTTTPTTTITPTSITTTSTPIITATTSNTTPTTTSLAQILTTITVPTTTLTTTITTTNSQPTETTKSGDNVYAVQMKCRFLNDTFDLEYNDKTSQKYITYTNKITMKMREFLLKFALRLLYIIFISLREGSVIVEMELIMASSTAVNTNELITGVRNAAVSAYGTSIEVISVTVGPPTEGLPAYAIILISVASAIFIIAAILIVMEIYKQRSVNNSEPNDDSDAENFEMENTSIKNLWNNNKSWA